MTDYRREAVAALQTLATRGGSELLATDLALFDKTPDEAEHHNKRVAEVYAAVFRGFFYCAADGVTLVPEERVVNRFGGTLQHNYPEASGAFLRFAKTYWTLRVLVLELQRHDIGWIGGHLLGKLEQDIGPVFFPFPGPVTIRPSKREKLQRELIRESEAPIDANEFMAGNAILIRDRSTGVGAAKPSTVSEELESFCKDRIMALAHTLDIAIRKLHLEYEAAFHVSMDMLSDPASSYVVQGAMGYSVASEDRGSILNSVRQYATSAGIPYHQLSPLNQLIVTIPPYVFYCLRMHLPDGGKVRDEARRLMDDEAFVRYLQEQLGYPISQTKGAFWRPSVTGFLRRIFHSKHRH